MFIKTTKFQDVVIVYKDLVSGKEHTQKDHYDMSKERDKERFLKSIVEFENPENKDRVVLKRVRFYDFFGTKVKESFAKDEFNQIEGYTDVLEVMKFRWKREKDISTLLD